MAGESANPTDGRRVVAIDGICKLWVTGGVEDRATRLASIPAKILFSHRIGWKVPKILTLRENTVIIMITTGYDKFIAINCLFRLTH